jgi:hypothetical protein
MTMVGMEVWELGMMRGWSAGVCVERLCQTGSVGV